CVDGLRARLIVPNSTSRPTRRLPRPLPSSARPCPVPCHSPLAQTTELMPTRIAYLRTTVRGEQFRRRNCSRAASPQQAPQVRHALLQRSQCRLSARKLPLGHVIDIAPTDQQPAGFFVPQCPQASIDRSQYLWRSLPPAIRASVAALHLLLNQRSQLLDAELPRDGLRCKTFDVFGGLEPK